MSIHQLNTSVSYATHHVNSYQPSLTGYYPGWSAWIVKQANSWMWLINNQLSETSEPLLIVTYEDMKSNISREVIDTSFAQA